MKSNYNQLGQYIEMVSRTNSDLKYGIEDVRGCSNTKQMMQTRANLIGRTYEKFIVLRPQEFVFNRRTTRNGEKIGMAYNNTDREYIFTNDYVAFRVKQEYLDKLLPDYLYMFFCRDEFDRYARYKSTGSATEFFNWEDMCAVPFEIPPMDFQQLVVNAYKVLNERIETKQKINDNLEATAQAYFDSLFFDESELNCTLADIALVNPVRPLAKGVEARYFEMATLPTNGCIPTGDFIKPYNGGVRFINGDTLIARITPCLENGKAAYINILEDNEVAFGSTEYIVFASKGNMPSSFYYFLIRNAKFVTFALQFMNGSSGRQRVSGEELASFPLCRPSCENLEAFDKVASLVLEQMKDNTYEIQKLKQLQEVIAATISSC